jgi:hypothetical protein
MLLSLPRIMRSESTDGMVRDTCGTPKNVDLTERRNS